ncbi:MAG: hypothetical protein EB075_07480 [Bacteroidetes bacterium]|nr:hypothetical protein [Bacteroidota bacterium]
MNPTTTTVALRNQIDAILTDISMMSADELLTLGILLEVLPEAPREETAHVRQFHPLRDAASGRVLPAPLAE